MRAVLNLIASVILGLASAVTVGSPGGSVPW